MYLKFCKENASEFFFCYGLHSSLNMMRLNVPIEMLSFLLAYIDCIKTTQCITSELPLYLPYKVDLNLDKHW